MGKELDTLRSRVLSRYEAAGQNHVLDNIKYLSSAEEERFLRELDTIMVEELSSLFDSANRERQHEGRTDTTVMEPFDGSDVGSTSDVSLVKSMRALGMTAIREGKVCALVLAGGQGTRLGFDGPKGMYKLIKNKSLFQLISERIIKLQILSKTNVADDPIIPWYIMTSPMNHSQTVTFFKEANFFNLRPEQVVFFEQGVLPCLDSNGRIILDSKTSCAMAPDGNGGIYAAMAKHNIFQHMHSHNVQYIHAFAIDNALVRPADPVFIGHCIHQNADCGNKVLWKRDASEKVGILVRKNVKPCIVEYSDMDPELMQQVDDNGKLLFGAANICNHFYTREFLEHTVLPNLTNLYHIADKKIPTYDPNTDTTSTPTQNNGVKLETFIFDVFPLSKKMAILQVQREEEFAPVKNAPGSKTDSPDQAREMISNLAKAWVQEAGAVLKQINDNPCEVSPLTSYAGEGLRELVQDKEINCPFSF